MALFLFLPGAPRSYEYCNQAIDCLKFFVSSTFSSSVLLKGNRQNSLVRFIEHLKFASSRRQVILSSD